MQGEYISGYLITSGAGIDNDLPRPPHRPDNSLPGIEGPVDPGYGVPLPPVIENDLPRPPHVSGPPSRPTYPVDPDYGIPTYPGVWPHPPLPGVWPPPQPVYPALPIYPTDTPEHPIAAPPGSVWPPLPPQVTGKILAFCWLVGIGYRWVVIDPSLKPDIGLPDSGNRPSNELPQTPQPKR